MLPDAYLPFNAEDLANPVFKHELRHVRWLTTEHSLKRYTKGMLLGIPILSGAWWLFETLASSFGQAQPASKYVFENLLILIAVGVMLLSSLYSVPALIGSFNAHYTSAYWDMLRLTPQTNSSIIRATYAIAQLRLWPLTALEMGLRASVVTLFVLTRVQAGIDLGSNLFTAAFWLILFSIVILFIGFIIIFEPILRIRLFIALHTLIAVHIKTLILALLVGLSLVITFHLLQFLLIGNLLASYNEFSHEEYGGIGIVFCLLPITLIGIVVAWLIGGISLSRTLAYVSNRAFQPD